MELHESGENYLETILILKKRNGYVRAIDIANEFNFSKASVSRAISKLKISGFITVDSKNQIELTDSGFERANKVYEKHAFLRSYLIGLGVSEKTAEDDACRMEHIISDETLNAIKDHCKRCLCVSTNENKSNS